METNEREHGPDHPDTAASLNNLALLYKAMGAYGKAEPLYQRALAISEKALGPAHPDTAMSLYNLAEHYEGLGAYGKAEPCCSAPWRSTSKHSAQHILIRPGA